VIRAIVEQKDGDECVMKESGMLNRRRKVEKLG
jgi:hypothetical protein